MTTLGVPSARAKHHLRAAELAAVCAGEVTTAVLRTLSAAQSSKHRLLVEGVRRRAAAWGPGVTDLLTGALRLLDEVEARSPQAVAGVLKMPHRRLGGRLFARDGESARLLGHGRRVWQVSAQ